MHESGQCHTGKKTGKLVYWLHEGVEGKGHRSPGVWGEAGGGGGDEMENKQHYDHRASGREAASLGRKNRLGFEP